MRIKKHLKAIFEDAPKTTTQRDTWLKKFATTILINKNNEWSAELNGAHYPGYAEILWRHIKLEIIPSSADKGENVTA